MSDSDLLNKLNAYCNELIGEVPIKPKNGKAQNQNECNDSTLKSEVRKHPNQILQDEKRASESKSSEERASSIKKTDDGFKIISQIPADDSDVSDAFYSDVESIDRSADYESETQETEDGFRITSHIPHDDSSISDAFESDLDESEWLSEAQERLEKKTNSNMKRTSITNPSSKPSEGQEQSKFNSVKKPLMKLIQDFDLQDKLFLNEKSQPRLNCRTPSACAPQKKCLSNEELTIIDYSSKRKRKTEKQELQDAKPAISSKTLQESQKDADATFKRARYEIFKFGLSGFKKEERQNAKIELAIKLGAKPPKKKAINYKKLTEQRKNEKQKEIERRNEEREAGLAAKKSKEREKKRRVNPTNINPPLGKFKDGILTLSKKDINTINM